MFPKIRGFPPNHPLKDRVFLDKPIHFWGVSPLFWEKPPNFGTKNNAPRRKSVELRPWLLGYFAEWSQPTAWPSIQVAPKRPGRFPSIFGFRESLIKNPFKREETTHYFVGKRIHINETSVFFFRYSPEN